MIILSTMNMSDHTALTGLRPRRLVRLAKQAAAFLVGGFIISSGLVWGAPAPGDWAGSWTGVAQMGATRLRLVFKISQGADGSWTAKVDSPDQGMRDIPVNSIAIKNDSVHMEVRALQGIYEGIAAPDMKRIAGRWQQGRQSLPLPLERSQGTNAASGLETLAPSDLAANKEAALKLAGEWNGTLHSAPTDLPLIVRIVKTAAGAATGTLDRPDQRSRNLALSAITLKDGAVHFEAYGIGASFQGVLEADGATLRGDWHEPGQMLSVDFKKAAAVKAPGPGAKP